MSITTAIILAGGKGERLKPLTDKVPKPMVDVLGRPLVEYQVLWLKDQGIKHIIFACGYKSEVIKDYFKDGSMWGLKIDYALEDQPLGRGGAFKNALQFISHNIENVYAANGDEVIVEYLQPFFEYHKQKKVMGTILLQRLISSFGIVEIDNQGLVTNFREKPELPHWINAGVYIFSTALIKMFPDIGDHEVETFPKLVEESKLAGFRPTGFRGTVNTLKELSELEKQLPLHFPKELLK